MFKTEQLVKLAKRENNLKRPYLYVNPIQGKHIPVNPSNTKEMCKALASEVEKRYAKEKLFIIGFAETATAIATYVASFLDNAVYIENTTRENEIAGEEYLYFTELHSHATEQKIDIQCFEDYLHMIDRIVFVGDEVTTGNTIRRLITEIKTKFPEIKIYFSIVSVLNSMSNKRIQELNAEGIDFIYLIKLPYEYKVKSLKVYEDKDAYIQSCIKDSYNSLYQINQIIGKLNPRKTCSVDEYIAQTYQCCIDVYEKEFYNKTYDTILTVGTEEFMYPAIKLAEYLQLKGVGREIRSHSTTRSPIMAFKDAEYPLYNRYEILSVYDDRRVTYIYNLEKYDKVIIMTDSKLTSHKGLESLMSALKKAGNCNISVNQWGV